MSIKFLRGNGLTDFRKVILNRIAEQNSEDTNDRFFYIVPNHVKFDAEVDIIRKISALRHENKDILVGRQPEVYSLSRLTKVFLNNKIHKKIISDAGLKLIILTLLNEHPNEMKNFQRMKNRFGFIEQLATQIKEFKNSSISSSELISASKNATDSLSMKLLSLSNLLSLVNEVFQEKEIMLLNDTLDYLANFFNENNSYFSNMHFYFEGFSNFTESEKRVILAISQKTDVTIGLIGNETDFTEGQLFYKPNQLVKQLGGKSEFIAEKRNISDTIEKIEQVWTELENQGYSGNKSISDLKIISSDTKEAELEFVANEIKKITKDGTIRYKDILILARDLNPYSSIVQNFFNQYNIPIFLDLDSKMNIHPIAELINGILTHGFLNFQYNDLMCVLKTGLLIPENWSRDKFLNTLYLVENYLLSQNINFDWNSIDTFQLYKTDYNFDEEEISSSFLSQKINENANELKTFIQELILELKNIIKNSDTNYDFLTSFIQFLISKGVINKQSSETEQEVWNNFVKLADEIVFLYGSNNFEKETMINIIKSSFSISSFTGVPNKLDGVRISESGAVQSTTYKVTFMIGATSQAIPAISKTKSIINDLDREFIFKKELFSNKYLQDSSKQKMASENLLFYQALLTSNEKIYISFSNADSSGVKLEMSQYVKRLAAVFDVEINRYSIHPENIKELIDRSYSINILNGHLLALKRNNLLNLSTIIKELKLKQNLFVDYNNDVVYIGSEIAKQLFGDLINISISGIEQYYRNPYDYFLKYGLKINKRVKQEINTANIGSYFHAGLQSVFNVLRNNDQSLKDYSDESEFNQLFDNSVQLDLMINENPALKVLASNEENKTIEIYLKKDLKKFLKQMRDIALVTNDKTIFVEQEFGSFGSSEATKIPALKIDKSIELRGKIDRIDSINDNYVIFDYKTNGKKFELNKLNAGLDLQLITYWKAADSILDSSREINIQAAVFLPIRQKKVTDYIKAENKPQILSIGDGKGDTKYIDNDDKASGLSLNENVIPETSLFPLSKRSKRVSVISSSDLQNYMQIAQEKIISASKKILNGEFDIAPYKDGQNNGIKYSDYKDITRFDVQLGDKYNQVKKEKGATNGSSNS
ncbi:MAG: PD-(D/E)XK nuclease family protein [Lactobacillaceae bacterium]|jgi:ATP-dependent helicase/nuclease subunit B|nr:PD-(D/E)XK nuclease family protein [Lactobacillaceae bacterium]